MDLVPLGEETGEGGVEGVVVLVEQFHLLQVDLLQDCGDIDALDEVLDLLSRLLVSLLVVVVRLLSLGVCFLQLGILLGHEVSLLVEFRKLDFGLDQLLSVCSPSALHLFRVWLGEVLESLLGGDFQVQHVLALLFLLLELLTHDLGVLLHDLEVVLELLGHLAFSFEQLGLLIGFSDATALDLVLELCVLFRDLPALSQDLLQLHFAHLLLRFQISSA